MSQRHLQSDQVDVRPLDLRGPYQYRPDRLSLGLQAHPQMHRRRRNTSRLEAVRPQPVPRVLWEDAVPPADPIRSVRRVPVSLYGVLVAGVQHHGLGVAEVGPYRHTRQDTGQGRSLVSLTAGGAVVCAVVVCAVVVLAALLRAWPLS